jgi:hypothetical protein
MRRFPKLDPDRRMKPELHRANICRISLKTCSPGMVSTQPILTSSNVDY